MIMDMRDAFFEELLFAARRDSRVVFLTADHGATALQKFESELPERYINVGISEQNMIGVAAGLASSGKIVFAYGIAPFVSLRVLEQLTLDVAAMDLPVNIVSVGAGFTYSTDGPSHHGLIDVAALLAIPNLSILNSSDPCNTKFFIDLSIRARKPHYIRIDKEKLEDLNRCVPFEKTASLGYSLLTSGGCKDFLVVSTGYITHRVYQILDAIASSGRDNFSHIDMHQINPITKSTIDFLSQFGTIITVEEGSARGLGCNIFHYLSSIHPRVPKIICLGTQHGYVFRATSRAELLEENLDLENRLRDSLDWKVK